MDAWLIACAFCSVGSPAMVPLLMSVRFDKLARLLSILMVSMLLDIQAMVKSGMLTNGTK